MRRFDALDLTPGVQGASSRVTRRLPILGLRTCSSLMPSFPTPTGLELAELLQVSESSIARKIKELQASGEICRIGADKNGHWEVVEQSQSVV